MDVVGAKALLSRISNGEHPNSVTRKLHLPSRFLAVAAAEIPDEHPEVQLLVGISADELVERLILLVDIAHIDQCVNNWKLEVLPTLSDTYHACKHCQHMQAHTHMSVAALRCLAASMPHVVSFTQPNTAQLSADHICLQPFCSVLDGSVELPEPEVMGNTVRACQCEVGRLVALRIVSLCRRVGG